MVNEQCLKPDQGGTGRGHPGRQPALHLMHRHPVKCPAAAIHQIAHGFRLKQIHLPVQVRPPGEFSRFGHARTRLERVFDQEARDEIPAVAGDLHHVLSRVAGRRGVAGDDAPVQELSGSRVVQCRQHRQPRARIAQKRRKGAPDGERGRPRESHHREGTRPLRGCRCHNGVRQILSPQPRPRDRAGRRTT